MSRTPAHALSLGLLFGLLLSTAPARADIQTKGAQVWPGKHELSVSLGGQAPLISYFARIGGSDQRRYVGQPTSGGRLSANYGYMLLDKRDFSIWFDAGFNLIFGTCNVALGNVVIYACDGVEVRPFAGVKAKFRTPIPLVPYAAIDAGAPLVFARYCGDTGFGAVGRLSGGAKYFLTKNIGLGLDTGFSLGPVVYSGASANNPSCVNYAYDAHLQFYAAWDAQIGAEFIF